MGHNDHINMDLYEAVQDLVDEGLIEDKSPAYGVAQQVVSMGHESLSPKQRVLYDAVIVPALKKRAEEIKIIGIVNSADD